MIFTLLLVSIASADPNPVNIQDCEPSDIFALTGYQLDQNQNGYVLITQGYFLVDQELDFINVQYTTDDGNSWQNTQQQVDQFFQAYVIVNFQINLTELDDITYIIIQLFDNGSPFWCYGTGV